MNILGQKISLRRILGMIAGVVIIGIGIAVFKFSHLGNDSISALNLRISELVGLSFSIENVLMNLFLFIPQLIWGRRYIGLGTIIRRFRFGQHAPAAAALGGHRRAGCRAGGFAVSDRRFGRSAL